MMMQFLLLKIKVACKKNCRFVLYFLPFGNCSLYSVLGIIKPFIPYVFFLSLIVERGKLTEPSLIHDSLFTCTFTFGYLWFVTGSALLRRFLF